MGTLLPVQFRDDSEQAGAFVFYQETFVFYQETMDSYSQSAPRVVRGQCPRTTQPKFLTNFKLACFVMFGM